MRQKISSLGAFVYLLLTVLVSACGGTSPVAPSGAGSTPTIPTPVPTPAPVQPLDLSGLSEGARNFIQAANLDGYGRGWVTIWPMEAPVKVYAEGLSSEGRLLVAQYWRDVTGGSMILQFVDTPAESLNGITLYRAVPPPSTSPVLDAACGLARVERIESGVIKRASGYVIVGLRPGCMIPPNPLSWEIVAYAHEIGHCLGISDHHFPPGEQVMSGPSSNTLIATAVFREAMTWLYRQTPGAKP
jgi:hypothetical protein